MQMIEHANKAWDVLYGIWDNDELINNLVLKLKNLLGIYFSDYQDLGWFKTLLNYGLRQFRKKINN